jgi:hypothetical protein
MDTVYYDTITNLNKGFQIFLKSNPSEFDFKKYQVPLVAKLKCYDER